MPLPVTSCQLPATCYLLAVHGLCAPTGIWQSGTAPQSYFVSASTSRGPLLAAELISSCGCITHCIACCILSSAAPRCIRSWISNLIYEKLGKETPSCIAPSNHHQSLELTSVATEFALTFAEQSFQSKLSIACIIMNGLIKQDNYFKLMLPFEFSKLRIYWEHFYICRNLK